MTSKKSTSRTGRSSEGALPPVSRRNKALVPVVIALLVAGSIPLILADEPYLLLILNLTGIYIIVNSGLDIFYGYAGQISIGQAGFYAVGAYTSALLSLHAGWPPVLTVLAGALLAAIAGVVIAFPSVKLVHHFLAMVTIGFGEIVRLVLLNGGHSTGGPDGVIGIPRFSLGPLVFDSNQKYFYVIYFSVAVFLAVKVSLIHSRFGRAFVAIRENPLASSAFGIHLQNYKVLAFAVGAFYAGFGGALYAHLICFVSPETFTLDQSVLFLTMVLLGGAGTFFGPILGTVIVMVLHEFLQRFGQAQMAVYGLIIICVLFFMPRGLVGKLGEIFERRRKPRREGA
jgi:branched-chain amino acid transport system permease protein